MFYQLTMCALQIVFMIMIMIIMIVILTFEKRDTGDLTENFCFFFVTETQCRHEFEY